MEGLMRGLGLGRRKDAAPTPPAPAPPLARPPAVPHHWLTLSVLRPGPAAPVPVPQARVVVRPFPRGATRPEEPVARGACGPDGGFAVLLPAGRYAVYAQHQGEGKAVTVTLEHAGRASILLESLGRRVVLSCEVTGPDGGPLADALVEVRTVPTGALTAREVTDLDGVAAIRLPPGAYEVRVGDTVARTYLEADTLLRLAAQPAASGPAPLSRYAQKARAAAASATAPLDSRALRDEAWN